MKIVKFNIFTVKIASEIGTFMQSVDIKADNIESAFAIGKKYAENIGGEVWEICKSSKPFIEALSNTISVDI